MLSNIDIHESVAEESSASDESGRTGETACFSRHTSLRGAEIQGLPSGAVSSVLYLTSEIIGEGGGEKDLLTWGSKQAEKGIIPQHHPHSSIRNRQAESII